MLNILVKSGVKQLPLFKNKEFSEYEAYLSGDENLTSLLNTEMKLIAIHLPHTVETSTGRKPIDFCDSGEIGKASFSVLKQILDFSINNNVKYIVIHLGFYNSLTEDRYLILQKIAQQFNVLPTGKVMLCLENIPCWTNLCFENEPIISNINHFLYFKKYCPKIGLTLDIDHLAINIVFQYFYKNFKENYLINNDKIKFRKFMEKHIQNNVQNNPNFFDNLIKNEFHLFLSKSNPDLIHAVGSDFYQYFETEHLPLIGEALPLGFEGLINGFFVKDRINHQYWLKLLKNNPPITIELMMRTEYDYLSEIRKSKDYLEKINILINQN